ncbi:chemotaxis protein CheA [Halorarum salinum]|uniref:Chemotaxis protein CheA n=1 Tax=Halorarum salinum TaxID=2743089 RepID=A0A7D5L8L9_9EURY|nr:chemotaxis protein CheA [Halobaculum salinum]QLG60753.1 chemotaxis protein CheA [Halobaculum salinum]
MSDAHVRAFVRESEEGITELNNSLLALESDPDDAAAMDAIFRTAHTLKGNAAAMGFSDFSGLAHAMEDLLDEVRDGDIGISPELMDLLFEGVDHLDAMLGEIDEAGETSVDPGDTEDALRTLAEDGTGALESDDEDGTAETDSASGSEGTASGNDGSEDDSAPADFDHGLDPVDDEGVYRAAVTLSKTDMPGVDAMFLLQDVENAFDGVATDPDREAVEDGAGADGFDCYLTARSAEEVRAGLEATSQVERVEVSTVEAAGGDRGGGREDDPAHGSAGPANESVDGEPIDDEPVDGDEPTAAEPNDDDGNRSGGSSETISSVRVDVDQLDDLYGLVEQLVTSRIKLRREMEEADIDSENLDELDKISSNLQNTVMDMRLIPLSAVVDTFPRLVRDLARGQDKEVSFDVDGRDIELDRTILTEIRDPLVHILRNAVDHGIEDPDEREAAGKDRTGTIELRADRERDHVTIVVEDDGGGIDADAVREKAVEKGVKRRGEVEAMDDDEARELVFHPGFSTNDEVTDVSGRGVGMDVVKTTVKELDGTVSLRSTPGEGTRFEIRLPVTVAIVRVMFIEVNGVEYGVPIKNIAEVSRADGVDVANGDEVVRHDGDIYPVVRLGEVFADATAGADSGDGSAVADGGNDPPGEGTPDGGTTRDGSSGRASPGDREDRTDGMLLRIREDKRPVALHCDEVLHQEEVVVKPLEGILSGTPGLSGTAVLGDGDVVSILDVETLGGGR